MIRQAGSPRFDERGMIRGGVIVRHLLLPGHVEESKRVVEYLYKTYGNQIYISIMNQYTPMPAMAKRSSAFPPGYKKRVQASGGLRCFPWGGAGLYPGRRHSGGKFYSGIL